MPKIIIYSKDNCPYCVKAKMLLERKTKSLGINFTEIKVTNDELRAEVVKKSGGRMSVPQIFIDDFHVGGCDDLYELENKNELDKLLKN